MASTACPPAFSGSLRLHSLNGIVFVGLLASAALHLARWPQVVVLGISPLIVGIVLGMLYGNTLRPQLPATWVPGILFSSKRLLRAAVVLYGFRLTFQDLWLIGPEGLAVAAFMLSSTFLGGAWLGMRVFGLPRSLALLTAAGSAVCGAAAVLAAEPVVRAKAHESGVAVGTVVLYGTLAMFIYPLLFSQGLLDLDARGYGLFAGATLHEVAHVVAAGQAVSPDAANTAVIVKMLRVMGLVPLLLVLGMALRHAAPENDNADGSEGLVDRTGGQTTGAFPWFALLFLACIGINSLGLLPEPLLEAIHSLDTFMLTMAMCALGLETRLESLRAVGPKPFILAGILAVWLGVGGWAATRFVLAF